MGLSEMRNDAMRNEDVVEQFLEDLDEELDGASYVLACRDDVCLNKRMFQEWLEDKFNDALNDTMVALEQANRNEYLRGKILSGEGDEETFGVTAYLFDDASDMEDFAERNCNMDNIELLTSLEDLCEVAIFSLFSYICDMPQVRPFL